MDTFHAIHNIEKVALGDFTVTSQFGKPSTNVNTPQSFSILLPPSPLHPLSALTNSS